MNATSQRRYMVTGDGITVHAQSLDEAIAAYRRRTRSDISDENAAPFAQESEDQASALS